MTKANFLTLLRLILSPLFLLIYIYPHLFFIEVDALPWVLLFIFALSELSDAFDGYVARKYREVTDLGKILDPMADSIARTSAFLTFTQAPVNLPVILIFIFIYRDSVVSTLRTICALKGFALAARISGKIKAVIQAIAIFLILLLMIPFTHGFIEQETLRFYAIIFSSVAAIYTIYSGIEYIFVNRHFIFSMMK